MGSRCHWLALACLTVACGGSTGVGHRASASGGAGGANGGGAVQHEGGTAGSAAQSGGTGSAGRFVGANGGLLGNLPSIEPPMACEDDSDGLSNAEEAAAGLDACNPDTNGDGCIDGAEVRFGGCKDPTNAVIVHRCDSSEPGASMTFIAPATDDGGFWLSLTLEQEESVQGTTAVYVTAASVSPEGPARATGAAFTEVPSGAQLTFHLSVPPTRAAGTGVIEFRLTARSARAPDAGVAQDAAGMPHTIATGKLLLVLRACAGPG